ncbi:MAG: hypothetical protein R2709_13405 [Marmoricola sp.]
MSAKLGCLSAGGFLDLAGLCSSLADHCRCLLFGHTEQLAGPIAKPGVRRGFLLLQLFADAFAIFGKLVDPVLGFFESGDQTGPVSRHRA